MITVKNADDTAPVFNPPISSEVNENQTFAIELNVEDESSITYYISDGVDKD